MPETRDWFKVSTEGLRQLQEGKPKHFVMRELVQNAWDENINSCKVTIEQKPDGLFLLAVEDNSLEGFKDLSDSFTLFRPTGKQADPTKRGRFNLGEKQAMSIAEYAIIETTKGTMRFDSSGRKETPDRRGAGSKVTIAVKLTADEHREMVQMLNRYLPPKGVTFTVNGKQVAYQKPRWVCDASLPTVISDRGGLRPTKRKSQVHVLERWDKESEPRYIYELGIPVCEIDCTYDLDVQQKIPLSPDREAVAPTFLSQLYAMVLNATRDDLTEDEAAETWVKIGIAHPYAEPETVKAWVKAQYGEEVVIASPGDKQSIEEALIRGVRVVYPTDLPPGLRKKIREAHEILSKDDEGGGFMPTSTAEFGTGVGKDLGEVKLTDGMRRVGKLAKKIARRAFHIEIQVEFRRWEGDRAAEFGNRVLRFNVETLGEKWFEDSVSAIVLDLLIHELAHHQGSHIERSYHDAMTALGGQLVMIALKEPEFFEL